MKLELSASGIDKLIKDLEKEQNDIIKIEQDIVDTTLNSAVAMAQSMYDVSQFSQAAPEDKSTKVRLVRGRSTKNTRKQKIVATGDAVAFYEFGAGVEAGQGYPKEYVPDNIIAEPGGWSLIHGAGVFDPATHPSWMFKNTLYTAIHPSMALYKTSKFIKSEIAAKNRSAFR